MLGPRINVETAAIRAYPLRVALVAALLLVALVAALPLVAADPADAAPTPALKTVTYAGRRLTVPAVWPVYRLASDPHACVRFDRHALYLGRPGSGAGCPAQPAGRTEAILVTPLSVSAAGARGAAASLAPTTPGADASGGSVAGVVDRAHRIVVTATWRTDPAVIERALGVRSPTRLAALARASRVRPRPYRPAPTRAPRTIARATARAAGLLPAPGQVYTGAGFDVCSTPSLATMTAWAAAYQAAGVYIGGANMACAQPNLTGPWVSAVAAEGWHLIPIYVGLQAPSNSCGCAAIRPAQAAAQGAAAAQDAVAQAQARGLGAGNPIYFDMEAYRRTAANTAAVLTFLSAWTEQLHAQGYKSGVYSSDGSGIADLVAGAGAGVGSEPDDVWIANWNGARDTDDPYVPVADWAAHQRLHQYAGGHNETHGGARLNIDGDFVDAATAAPGGAVAAAAPPQTNGVPGVAGTAVAGEALAEVHAPWAGAPTGYTYLWEGCDAAGENCAPIPGATARTLTLTAAQLGQTVRVTETAGNPMGAGAPVTSAPTAPVLAAPGAGYWLLTSGGRVYNSAEMAWYGSGIHTGASGFTGLARTADGAGYWLTNRQGRVFAFGDAALPTAVTAAHPVAGIVAGPAGTGYWLYTAYGNVYSGAGAAWYGSAARARDSTITGMAATSDGRGYWLVNAAGRVYARGDAAAPAAIRPAHPIIGIVANPAGSGYWLYTARGNVYAQDGAPAYGSAVHLRQRAITGMVATADGHGYWLVNAYGRVFAYGDAGVLPRITGTHPIIGIAR